ncbi:hypothetical protein GF325_06700 [Candidatus Bathyarchaeota archaeon]|nr:hypothetical protein [Candidatus Bathyarchaeota archaeon]
MNTFTWCKLSRRERRDFVESAHATSLISNGGFTPSSSTTPPFDPRFYQSWHFGNSLLLDIVHAFVSGTTKLRPEQVKL